MNEIGADSPNKKKQKLTIVSHCHLGLITVGIVWLAGQKEREKLSEKKRTNYRVRDSQVAHFIFLVWYYTSKLSFYHI